jgi:hypothetical protein
LKSGNPETTCGFLVVHVRSADAVWLNAAAAGRFNDGLARGRTVDDAIRDGTTSLVLPGLFGFAFRNKGMAPASPATEPLR